MAILTLNKLEKVSHWARPGVRFCMALTSRSTITSSFLLSAHLDVEKVPCCQ